MRSAESSLSGSALGSARMPVEHSRVLREGPARPPQALRTGSWRYPPIAVADLGATCTPRSRRQAVPTGLVVRGLIDTIGRDYSMSTEREDWLAALGKRCARLRTQRDVSQEAFGPPYGLDRTM